MPALATLFALAALGAGDFGLSGVAVGLHETTADRVGLPFPPPLEPIADLGAKAVLLAPSWSQADLRSADLEPDRNSVSDQSLRATIRAARKLGLDVVLMPIVRLRAAGPDDAWRGRLAPDDPQAWWARYARFVLHYAELAHDEHVRLFVIGSELSSLSGAQHRRHWRLISEAVHQRFSGLLAYSANHDALDLVTPFAFVDVIGISAYFPVANGLEPTEPEVRSAWVKIEAKLSALQARVDKPILLLELGYPSVDGAGMRPWDDRTGSPIDLQEQALLYRIAVESLRHSRVIKGAFFWEWFGRGGRFDRTFTFRGKPAAPFVEAFVRGAGVRPNH